MDLNKNIGLLLNSHGEKLAAFVISEEENPLVSARALFTKFYAGDLEFSEELWESGARR